MLTDFIAQSVALYSHHSQPHKNCRVATLAGGTRADDSVAFSPLPSPSSLFLSRPPCKFCRRTFKSVDGGRGKRSTGVGCSTTVEPRFVAPKLAKSSLYYTWQESVLEVGKNVRIFVGRFFFALPTNIGDLSNTFMVSLTYFEVNLSLESQSCLIPNSAFRLNHDGRDRCLDATSSIPRQYWSGQGSLC